MSDKTMPLMQHLVELRNVLIKSVAALLTGTVFAAIFTPQILQFLIVPYGTTLQTIDPTENISIYLRVAIMAGAVIAMPIFVYLIISTRMTTRTMVRRRRVYGP